MVIEVDQHINSGGGKMKFAPKRPVRNLLLAIATAALLIQPGCRSTLNIPGQRLALTGTQLEDFSKQITSQLFENGMMVGVGNDDGNLYIFFTPDIRHRQRPPGRVSLTLWLDENGGKAKSLGLVHVSGAEGREIARPGKRPPAGEEEGGPGMERTGPPRAGDAPLPLKIIDARQGRESLITADGSQGPAVRVTSDWGDFAYQWRIPFKAMGDWPGLNVSPGGEIGIGLLWRIEDAAGPGKKEEARRRGGPGRDGPGSGPPPGMEGSGPRSGPGRGMGPERLPSKRSLWLKTRLLPK
jgi:hypothetical protein